MNMSIFVATVESLALAITAVLCGFLLRRAAVQRVYDRVALIRCQEDRQAAQRKLADDKLVRMARIVVGAVDALPEHYRQQEMYGVFRAVTALNSYLVHLDGRVPR